MNKFICAVVVAVMAISFAGVSYAEKDRLGDMHKALNKLEQVRHDLDAKKSGDEYDGYRERAIHHIEEAKKELQDAIEYAKAHPKDIKHHDGQ
jgi:ElaB/YqjD/DUF883 family membrane-anchored ribosome-binding protein